MSFIDFLPAMTWGATALCEYGHHQSYKEIFEKLAKIQQISRTTRYKKTQILEIAANSSDQSIVALRKQYTSRIGSRNLYLFMAILSTLAINFPDTWKQIKASAWNALLSTGLVGEKK